MEQVKPLVMSYATTFVRWRLPFLFSFGSKYLFSSVEFIILIFTEIIVIIADIFAT